MTSLAKCFPSTHRTSYDFLIDYIKFTHILTPYKVPQRLSLICSDFSGDQSWEETASVIQFVGRERVHKLTTSLTCNHAREGHPYGQQKLPVPTPKTFVATKSCLLQQNICHDMHIFLTTKDPFCHDKHMFVATKVSLSQQKFCRNKHTFVMTKALLCCNKDDTCGSSRQCQGKASPWTAEAAGSAPHPDTHP